MSVLYLYMDTSADASPTMAGNGTRFEVESISASLHTEPLLTVGWFKGLEADFVMAFISISIRLLRGPRATTALHTSVMAFSC